MTYPAIKISYESIRFSEREVVHPSTDKPVEFLDALVHVFPSVATSNLFYFVPESLNGLWCNANFGFLELVEPVTKELSSWDIGDCALYFVDPELKFIFEEGFNAQEHPESCSSGTKVYIAVVCIADEA
jgi:hypothetical protein